MPRIWLWNHYATNMFFDKAGRHYWFGKYLLKKGYKPTVFCASTNHFTDMHIDTEGKLYKVRDVDGIDFVFVKVPEYAGNGRKRIINMLGFYRRVKLAASEYAAKSSYPEVILASSVHPLTLVAGLQYGKKNNVPCICEVRDLWPESLVAYGVLGRESILAKLLYQGEKWIYKKADAVVMTWEGGLQYIIDKGWEKDVAREKVTHISNGVIIDDFDRNSLEHPYEDDDIDDIAFRNIVYAGSIRKVNNLGVLLEAAMIIKDKLPDVRFLIYGSGDEKDSLIERCQRDGIDNVVFKGRVPKATVPAVLKKSYANILHNSSTDLDKYGQSQNKFFEYMASGRPIIQTYTTGYSICDKYQCGVSAPKQTAEDIANTIQNLCGEPGKVEEMGHNARKAAYHYDFESLTDRLIALIERL